MSNIHDENPDATKRVANLHTSRPAPEAKEEISIDEENNPNTIHKGMSCLYIVILTFNIPIILLGLAHEGFIILLSIVLLIVFSSIIFSEKLINNKQIRIGYLVLCAPIILFLLALLTIPYLANR